MAGANDVAGSDNANPQLVIVFVHRLRCELRLTAAAMARSTLEQYGFPAVEFKIYGCPSRHSLEDHPLDQSACARQVTELFSRQICVTSASGCRNSRSLCASALLPVVSRRLTNTALTRR